MILWFLLWGQGISAMPIASIPWILVNVSAGYHSVAAPLPAAGTICTTFCCSTAKGHGGHTKHEHTTSLWKSTEMWNPSLLFDHNKVPQMFKLGLMWCLGSFPCNLVRNAAAGWLQAGSRRGCPGTSGSPRHPSHACGCAWAVWEGGQRCAASLRLPAPWLGNKSTWQERGCKHSRGTSEAVIQGVSRSAVGMGGERGAEGGGEERGELAGLFEYQALPHSRLRWQLHYLHI